MNNKEYKHLWYLRHRKITIERARKWEATHSEYNRDRRKKIKRFVFRWLGGCVCKDCGINDFEVLSHDHVDGGGKADRANLPTKYKTGDAMYKKLYPKVRNKETPPKNLEVVCRNCNWKRHLKKLKGN